MKKSPPRGFAALVLLALACHNAGSPEAPPAVLSPAPSLTARSTPASQPPVSQSAVPPSTTARPTDAATPTPSEPQRPWPPPPPAGVARHFCDVMDTLDEETCYVLPERPPSELLLYLHGIVPPTKKSLQKTNLQTVVASAARRASVAVLLPRGRRGLAPKDRSDWYGWPTTAGAYTQLAAELVQSFAAKRETLEALSGTRFTRLYVAGSSSGAYFTVALALNGGIDADAFAALSGGAFPPRERLGELPPRPFYIGYGSFDTVGSDARVLERRLRAAGWPVEVSVHAVSHGAKEVYLDEAFAFFRSTLRPDASTQ